MSKDGLSRRGFLQIAGLSLTALAASEYAPTLMKLRTEPDFLGEPITVGNLELTPFLTQHDQKTWNKDGAEISKQLRDYQMIIPEYFPPEYQSLVEENPLLDQALNGVVRYDKANYLFTQIADFAAKESNPIWVVDPAYSEAFIKLRALKNWWTPLLGAIVASPVTKYALSHTKLSHS